MLCREMPDELTSQQASVIRSFRASSTFFRMEPWTRRASNMVAVEFYVCADEKMRKASLRAQVLCCWRAQTRHVITTFTVQRSLSWKRALTASFNDSGARLRHFRFLVDATTA